MSEPGNRHALERWKRKDAEIDRRKTNPLGKYEYRVVIRGADGTEESWHYPAPDTAEGADLIAQDRSQLLDLGESIEIQQREVGEWITIKSKGTLSS